MAAAGVLLAAYAVYAMRRAGARPSTSIDAAPELPQEYAAANVASPQAVPAVEQPSVPAQEAFASEPPESEQLRDMREAMERSYASTMAAFSVQGEDADYERHDADAKRDAERLQASFESARSALGPELAEPSAAFVERIATAQLQLMAFAINRKNRGVPDSAALGAEIADREAFKKEIEPLYARVYGSPVTP